VFWITPAFIARIGAVGMAVAKQVLGQTENKNKIQLTIWQICFVMSMNHYQEMCIDAHKGTVERDKFGKVCKIVHKNAL
jgi:hypothetical protein